MASGLILLTGATGFLGIRVLALALERGYQVRCAIRKATDLDKLRGAPRIERLSLAENQLSSVVVPDMTVSHAYDEAVKGARYIVHCASPMPNVSSKIGSGSEEDAFVTPAVLGVMGILASGAEHAKDTLKRVVITSSIVAITPPEYFIGKGDSSKLPVTSEWRIPNLSQPYMPGFGVYQASKTKSLNTIEEWQSTNATPFDIITLMPSLILGVDDLATTPRELEKSGNAILLSLLKGNQSPIPLNSAVVDVNDVALAHLRSLDENITGNQSFILGGPGDWIKTTAIAKSVVPGAFSDGILQEGGVQHTFDVAVDARKTEGLLDIKPTPYHNTVAAVAIQYVELCKGAKV
ncbi:NAD(P)-binding protein [Eremomyces bilateralis CBS 781.70]|uniref:NAD(P)-binding protein n=1 Tax=Eremomyces bilateralis CBS 781.70 TaxID=1392243 RepID=A0A6G1FQR9_9PEZI|nr:NAD(P)-binding protein [Eremomyces bilateralis CBS 781.70]KAF1808078.1 NAD(P)-binding protein [Eremomyces bilateralis CBS 781.70]